MTVGMLMLALAGALGIAAAGDMAEEERKRRRKRHEGADALLRRAGEMRGRTR